MSRGRVFWRGRARRCRPTPGATFGADRRRRGRLREESRVWISVLVLSVAAAAGACTRDTRAVETTTTTVAAKSRSSSAPQGAAPSAPAAPSLARVVEVQLDDYAVSIAPLSVAAGGVTVSVSNGDAAPHDIVLVATDLPADRLPTRGIRVDETSPDLRILARTPTLAPGGRSTISAELRPGRYLLLCTVPHHYVRNMMVATLVVES